MVQIRKTQPMLQALRSMSCWITGRKRFQSSTRAELELFEAQDAKYQQATLGGDVPRVAVEAGVRFGWDRWIGHDGGFVGCRYETCRRGRR